MNVNIAQKAALRSMMNTPGWGVAQELMTAAVEHLQEQIFKAEGDDQIIGAAREARGARKFRETFNSLIESAASIE